MKVFLTISFIIFSFNIIAQDKFFTKGFANGYAWTAPPSESKVAYAKGQTLSDMLFYNTLQTDLQRKVAFPLDCQDDIDKLLESSSESIIELETVEKMIDEFYIIKENLIIPVPGAYCYNIKKLSGISPDELEKYRIDLLEYSKK